MSTTKHALIRYHALDKCFRNKTKYYSLYDLAEVCATAIREYSGPGENDNASLSIKQIRHDINFMRSLEGFDIEEELIITTINGNSGETKTIRDFHDDGSKAVKVNRKKYYYYKDPNFSISNRPLTGQDAEQLKETLLTLKRFKGLPQFDWIDEMSIRLKKFMDLGDDKNAVISFDSNPHLQGLNWIDPLYQAIINGSPMKISYSPFDKSPEIHQISPYLLKQYNKRWFVLCKTNQTEYLMNLALDRIQKVEPSNGVFNPYLGDNPEDFFEDIVGVTSYAHEAVQTISLDVKKSLWPYIRTKPIHESQKSIKATEELDWVRVEFQIKTNYEFYSVILSHGAKIRIISPQSAKDKMKSFIKEMSNHY